jgi:hypothetical protein
MASPVPKGHAFKAYYGLELKLQDFACLGTGVLGKIPRYESRNHGTQ